MNIFWKKKVKKLKEKVNYKFNYFKSFYFKPCYLIKKLKVFDFFGNENEVEFTSIKMDASLSDSTFNFTPPKGVEVQDRIENNNVPEKNLFQ